MLVSDTFHRVACDEEAPHAFAASTSEAEGSPKRRLSRAKIAAVVVGVTCLASVAACLASVAGGKGPSEAPPHSARALLESPDMADVVTRNYITLWPDLKQSERRLHDKVITGMKKITTTIKYTEPKVFQQLNELSLSEPQKNSILKVLGSMSDKRVQAVGEEVAKITHRNKMLGKQTLMRQLEEAFQQNKTKLSLLRNEIVPAPLRSMVDTNWQVSFDPARMHLVRDSKDSWDFEVSVDKPSSRRLADISETNPGSEFKPSQEDLSQYSDKFEEGLGVLTGLLEQARVALDQIDFVGESFDVDMKIPYWAKSLVGGLDFIGELSDCVMRGESNEVKLMMCPMKYASAATDFLESFDNVMGMNNGHFFGGRSTSIAPGGYNYAQQIAPAAATAANAPAPALAQQQQQYAPQGATGLYR
jgi:hypothetical protein